MVTAISTSGISGWPTYPGLRLVKPRPLGGKTKDLVKKMMSLGQPGTAKARISKEIKAAIASPNVDKVIDAVVAAQSALIAERIEKSLRILQSPELLEAVGELEGTADQFYNNCLSGWLALRRVGPSGEGEIPYGSEYSQTFRLTLRDAGYYLTPAELADPAFIRQLIDDDRAPNKLIAERKARTIDPSLIEATRHLYKLLKKIKGIFLKHCSDGLFPNLLMTALGKELKGTDMIDSFWEKEEKIGIVKKFLTHDINHCFAELMGYKAGKIESDYFTPLYFLHGYRVLGAHLAHLTNALKVAKFRLDGIRPLKQSVALSPAIETAAIAAAYRLGIPINRSSEPKKGYLNFLPGDDRSVSIIPEFLELTIYNMIKNSIKPRDEAGEIMSNIQVDISTGRDRDQVGIQTITIKDNGGGFNMDVLLEAAKKIAADPANRDIVTSMPVFKKLAKWQQHPMAFRTLTTGDILDLAFATKISGHSSGAFSSGLGLAEAAEFAQMMGADIILTNDYHGGALITILIGEETGRHAVIRRELGYST